MSRLSRAFAVLLATMLALGRMPPFAGTEGPEDTTRIAERVPVGVIPPKEGPEGMDGRLMGVAAAAREGEAQGEFLAKERGLVVREGLVQVVVEVSDGTPEDLITAFGGRVEGRYQGMLQALVPPAALDVLAGTPGVLRIRAPQYGQRLQTMSEGTAGMGIDVWHEAGLRGAGARVAIADLGFDGYSALLGQELPGQVTLRSFRADGDITGGGDPHGTASAEVVYDIAPDATFLFVNFSTEVELGSAVDWLITQGVQIINSSVGWPGTAFGDGKGTVNDIVRKAERAGILWVQGAGNFGQTHWSGLFNDQDGNRFHNFAPGDEGNTISLRRLRPNAEQIFRVEVFLTWDDWDTFNQDYDLFLFRGEAVVAQSTAFQNGKFPPVEHIVYTTAGAGDYWIAVQQFRATRRSRIDVVVTIDYSLEHKVASESLVVPADSPFALSVGAVEPGTHSASSGQALNFRPYSSQGPTKDGRIKPDLVAGDQVTTATYGPGGYPGTSASAPHVAGAAALIKGLRPDLAPAVLRQLLIERADGPGPEGRNNQIGAGYVNLGEVLGRLFLPMVPNGVAPSPPP